MNDASWDLERTDTQRVVWLARTIASEHAGTRLIAWIAGVDHQSAVEALAAASVPRGDVTFSPVSDDLRARLIEVLFEDGADPEMMASIRAHLDAMDEPPAESWERLADLASTHGDVTLEAEAAERALRAAADESASVDQLLEHVIRAAAAVGRSRGSAAAERHIRRGIQLADRSTRPDALARVLALRLDPGLNLDHSWLGLFDHASEQLGEPTSVIAVELMRAQVYATYLSDPVGSRDLALRALSLAEELEDERAMGAALDARRIVAARASHLDELSVPAGELIRLGRRGDTSAAASGYEAAIIVDLLSGDSEGVENDLDAYSGLAAKSGQPAHRLHVELVHTLLALRSGDLDRSASKVASTFSHAAATGNSLAMMISLAQRAMLAIERDQMGDAIDLSATELENHPLIRWWKLAALLAATRRGSEAEAADLLNSLIPNQQAIEDWRFLWLGEISLFADASALVGDVRRCRELRDVLAPHSDRYAGINAAVAFGSVWRSVAALSAALDEDDRASLEFERAEQANRGIGAMPWVCRGLLGHAELLIRRGDQPGARAKVEGVLATTRRLGLVRIEREALRLREDLVPPRPVVLAPGLSKHECDIIVAVSAGKTNRELARDFSVSIKTVERHLSTIYTKLGVTNRKDAVSVAFDHEDVDSTRPTSRQHIRAVS